MDGILVRLRVKGREELVLASPFTLEESVKRAAENIIDLRLTLYVDIFTSKGMVVSFDRDDGVIWQTYHNEAHHQCREFCLN